MSTACNGCATNSASRRSRRPMACRSSTCRKPCQNFSRGCCTAARCRNPAPRPGLRRPRSEKPKAKMTMKKPASTLAWIAAGAASMLMLGALNASAGDYPDHPIRLLVPGAAGGGMDNVARLVANTIGETLKQPVVVENRPGAAGDIAVNQLAKSRPDGYTMVLGQTSQLAINPSLYGNLPYDPIKDFVPVARNP